jgi:PhnB protein
VVAEVRPGRRTPDRERSHQVMLEVEDVAAVVGLVVGGDRSSCGTYR